MEKRRLFAVELFVKENMWVDMEGFAQYQMGELFEYIVAYRLRNFKRGFHSRPMSLQRFCPDSSSNSRMARCKLKKLLGWCDMHHVEDVENGDILYTKCHENFDYDTVTCVVMLAPHKYSHHDGYTPLFLAPIVTSFLDKDSRVKSFFDFVEGETKNMGDFYYPPHDNGWELCETYFHESKSRYIASFARFTAWVVSHYHLTTRQKNQFKFDHCVFLEKIGYNGKHFLNLLVNGCLPRQVLLYVLEQDLKVKNVAANRVKPEMFIDWIKECGSDVFKWLPQLIERSMQCSAEDRHLDLTLQQLKTAMKVDKYMRDKTQTKIPDCIPENMTVPKLGENNIWYYENFDIFRVINYVIQNHAIQQTDRNLSDLHNYHSFKDWKEKKKERRNRVGRRAERSKKKGLN